MKKAKKALKRKASSVKRQAARKMKLKKAKTMPKKTEALFKEKKFNIKRMPKKALKKYKELLLKEREKIGGGLSHIAQDTLKTSQRDASGDLSGYSFHMADMASDNYEVEFSLGRASEEQDILYAIDEALKRIADGTYGNCPQCGKQISKKRLNAIPHTELCIACQSKNENK